MFVGEVPKFVRDHRGEFRLRQPKKEGKTEYEIILALPKRPHPRPIHHGRVEFGSEDNVMDWGRSELLLQTVYHLAF